MAPSKTTRQRKPEQLPADSILKFETVNGVPTLSVHAVLTSTQQVTALKDRMTQLQAALPATSPRPPRKSSRQKRPAPAPAAAAELPDD